jgi:hypothetical protein
MGKEVHPKEVGSNPMEARMGTVVAAMAERTRKDYQVESHRAVHALDYDCCGCGLNQSGCSDVGWSVAEMSHLSPEEL